MHPGEEMNGVKTESLEEFNEGPIEKAGGQGKETKEMRWGREKYNSVKLLPLPGKKGREGGARICKGYSWKKGHPAEGSQLLLNCDRQPEGLELSPQNLGLLANALFAPVRLPQMFSQWQIDYLKVKSLEKQQWHKLSDPPLSL